MCVTKYIHGPEVLRYFVPKSSDLSLIGDVEEYVGELPTLIEARFLVRCNASISDGLESFCTTSKKDNVCASLIRC